MCVVGLCTRCTYSLRHAHGALAAAHAAPRDAIPGGADTSRRQAGQGASYVGFLCVVVLLVRHKIFSSSLTDKTFCSSLTNKTFSSSLTNKTFSSSLTDKTFSSSLTDKTFTF